MCEHKGNSLQQSVCMNVCTVWYTHSIGVKHVSLYILVSLQNIMCEFVHIFVLFIMCNTELHKADRFISTFL